MTSLIGFSRQSGIRLAEIGLVFVVFAGVWFAAADIPQLRMARTRMAVTGVALAIGGVLLIIATHWGHFS